MASKRGSVFKYSFKSFIDLRIKATPLDIKLNASIEAWFST